MLSAGEKALLGRVDVDGTWSVLESICAFDREHPNDVDRAVEIVAERLQAAGVPAVVARMDLYLSLPGAARVVAGGTTYKAKPSSMSVAAPAGLAGELLYVPATKDMIASLLDPSQDAGGLREKIQGRIVLTDGIAGPGVVSSFAPLGALAVIAINPGKDIHSAICTPIWGNPELRSLDRKPLIPVLSVNRPDGDTLIEFARTAGNRIELFSELEEGWFPSKYVTVDIQGTTEPERFALLHGHIDSWHLGVGDNGTGCATMFDVARMLWAERANLRRSVRIAWWPGHSTGRYAGSTWYADHFAIDLAENCVAQINCDSPGCRWATAYIDLFCMPEAAGFLTGAILDATGKQAEIVRPFRAADWSFNNIGVTGILALSSTMPRDLTKEKGYYRTGGNGGNIEWHTDRDNMDIADRDVLRTDTQLYALTAFRVANADVLPFDFRPAAAEYAAALTRYQGLNDKLDLKPAIDACAVLATSLERFYGAVAAGKVAPAKANDTILALERALVPAHFAQAGRYQHDPALDTPPLPAIALAQQLPKLDPDQVPFALTQITRGRNQIVAAFREATRVADAA